MLCRVKLNNGKSAFVYLLFEHKSYPDPLVAWQILKYLVRIWDPDFRYHLHDLSRLDQAEIKGHLLVKLGMLALKHIFDERLDRFWDQIIGLLRREPEPGAFDYLFVILRYIAGVRERATEAEVKNLLRAAFPDRSEEVMETLAQAWAREAREQGLQQGLEAMRSFAMRFLRSRFGEVSETLRTKIYSLSLHQMEALGDCIPNFTSLSELEDWLSERCH